jgi:hypothetical protein
VDEENAKYSKLLLGMISLLCAIAPMAFCQVENRLQTILPSRSLP